MGGFGVWRQVWSKGSCVGEKKLPVLVSYFDNKFNWLKLDNILKKYKFNQKIRAQWNEIEED